MKRFARVEQWSERFGPDFFVPEDLQTMKRELATEDFSLHAWAPLHCAQVSSPYLDDQLLIDVGATVSRPIDFYGALIGAIEVRMALAVELGSLALHQARERARLILKKHAE